MSAAPACSSPRTSASGRLRKCLRSASGLPRACLAPYFPISTTHPPGRKISPPPLLRQRARRHRCRLEGGIRQAPDAQTYLRPVQYHAPGVHTEPGTGQARGRSVGAGGGATVDVTLRCCITSIRGTRHQPANQCHRPLPQRQYPGTHSALGLGRGGRTSAKGAGGGPAR